MKRVACVLAAFAAGASGCGEGPLGVEAVVLSSSANPRVVLNATAALRVCKALKAGAPAPSTCRSLGFVGFSLGGSFVRAGGAVDSLLLDHFEAAGAMSPEVLAHCRAPVPAGCSDKEAAPVTASADVDCTKTPIVGPDTPPTYDVAHDDGGCFKKEQSHNNCYNYGTDVVTNNFAQPGMGSGNKWQSNTCEDMQASAVRDGLVFVGGPNMTVPTAQPKVGHWVGLYIWPRSNFHWARMDGSEAPFYWSHKPGGTAVKNVDNNGDRITDPSKADMSPWTQFCGYFTVVPSHITIKGDR